jgi:hypothetical protein
MSRTGAPGIGLVLAVLLAVDPAAQEGRAVVTTAMRDAQALVTAAFPELHDRGVRVAWRIEPTATGFVVEAGEAVVPFGAGARAPALVIAAVVVDDDGRVTAVRTSGVLLERAQQRAREATAGRVSDQAIADALRNARARFVPDDVSDPRTLVPAGIHQRLGAPEIRIATFRGATEEGPEAALTWRVELDRQEASGVLTRYTLVIEPMDGRLVSLVRR